jgi:hypothetical protein
MRKVKLVKHLQLMDFLQTSTRNLKKKSFWWEKEAKIIAEQNNRSERL